MPIYDYQCKKCGHEWEVEQKINDPAIEQCPNCSEIEAKRLISGGTSFHLKGGGWASEGYK